MDKKSHSSNSLPRGFDYYQYYMLVADILIGKYGRGRRRKKLLEKAGYSYEKAQALVNTVHYFGQNALTFPNTGKKNIIFLDFDGVLNSNWWLVEGNKKIKGLKEFDPKRIKILKEIIKGTDAKVVLTSSWRNREGIKEFFSKCGIKVYDSVKDLGKGNRGEEIQEWLDTHHFWTNYLILDDECSDLTPEQLKHTLITRTPLDTNVLVKRDDIMGLQPQHIPMAISLMNYEEIIDFSE